MEHHTWISLVPIYIFSGLHTLDHENLVLFATSFVFCSSIKQRLKPNPLCCESKPFICFIYFTFRLLAGYVRMGSSWESWVILLCSMFLSFVVLFLLELNWKKNNLNVLLWKWWQTEESYVYQLAADVRRRFKSWLGKICSRIL